MAADLLAGIRAEIDARLRELRPQIAEYERLLSAADALVREGRAAASPGKAPARRAASKSPRPVRRKRERTERDATGQAIVAALEHGSHTVSELVVVTALPAPKIRDGLRRLRTQKAIIRTDRDGKSAYALPASSS